MKKTGILLLNLGTPDSPSVKDVRKYLREFLSDPKVIDINPVGRFLLVNLIIAPFRGPKSAKEYAKLFKIGNGKSPLLSYGEQLKDKVQNLVKDDCTIELAMRYGNPSMKSILSKMQKANYDKIILFPLYPQYAEATTGSTLEKAFEIINQWKVTPEIETIEQFYNQQGYIDAVVKRADSFNLADFDHVLFSYHGLPKRQLDKAHGGGKTCDNFNCENEVNTGNQKCYLATCHETTQLLAKKLNLAPVNFTTVFQSRLGKDPWLEPYADQTIKKLAKEGKKNLLIFSPAFVADCLETTLEIGEEYLHLFKENGGENLTLVPSLNAEDDWVDFICQKTEKL